MTQRDTQMGSRPFVVWIGVLLGGCGTSWLDAAPHPSPPPLAADASLRLARVQPGYSLQLMAAEPLVADPVAIDWGPDGRLWVVEMADYPYGIDGQGRPGGRIRFLEDTNQDGLYDRSVVFLEGISFPTAVMPWRQGVLVTAAPELFFAQDTDGDGRADHREVLFRGFMEGNQQLRVNGLRYGIDNWVYCAAGGHHAGFGADNSILIVPSGERVALGSRDFRFRPNTRELDPLSGPSQFGRVRDDWGHWFGVQNSYPLWHYVLEDPDLRRNPRGRYGDVRQQLRLPPNPAVFPASSQQKRFHSFEHSGHYTSACGPCIYRDDKLFARGDVTHAFTCEPFHNLVQHHELWEEGVSFRGQRAATVSPYEFFASADRWSRPVMARTGPDGALWIVDMYRFMIEHPDWLPPEGRDELKPFYRAGEGLGRIYRVYASRTPPPPLPRLDSQTDPQLVQWLNAANGPLRDLAQRLLIERLAVDQQPQLESLLHTARDPRARLHALATLDGLQRLADAQLVQALADPHPLVRRHALRIVPSRSEKSAQVVDAVLARGDDPSSKVRLQLTLTLGDIPGDVAGQLLRRLAVESEGDPFRIAAVISSASRHLEALIDGTASGPTLPPEIRVALLELAIERPDLMTLLLRRIVPRDPTAADASTLGRCADWLQALNQRGRLPSDLDTATDRDLAVALRGLDQTMLQAWTTVFQPAAPDDLREASLRLIRYDRPERRREGRGRIAALLGPQSTSEIQVAAVAVLTADRNDADAVPLVWDAWASFLPATRQVVLDQLLGDESVAVPALLARIADGRIARQDLDVVSRDRLLHQRNGELASRAQKLFASAVDTDRAAALARYREALTISGDAPRGAQLFAQHCATCHSPAQGTSIGPDLKSLSDRSAESLLVSILDPSRAVEPRYLGYHVELKSGEVLFGLILGETGNTLRIRPLTGPTRELLRDSIEDLQSSRRSFMPDGLEAELSPQDLADVIRHVQQL